MGIKLIVEVLDRAPSNLTSGERMVLVVLAEWANDTTRQARQSPQWNLDTLACRAGLSRAGLKTALHGLSKKGYEVRVPVGETRDGKPVFAYEGTAVTFRIPKLPERGCHSNPSEGMPQQLRGDAVTTERGCHSHPHPLTTPQVTDQISTTSGRFAPSGGAATIPSQRDGHDDTDRDYAASPVVVEAPEPDPDAAQRFVGARANDRELFRLHVGADMIRSDGRLFTEGTFRWEQFYDAFRKWQRKKPIAWPGKWLEKIANDHHNEAGVEDWLINLGLEAA